MSSEPKTPTWATANWVYHTTPGEAWHKVTPRSTRALSFAWERFPIQGTGRADIITFFLSLAEADTYSSRGQRHARTSPDVFLVQCSFAAPGCQSR